MSLSAYSQLNFKGTTFLRLFLLLSLSIYISTVIPPLKLPFFFPIIVLVSLFLISVVLYCCHLYRLSVITCHLIIVAYGLLLTTPLSSVQQHISTLLYPFETIRNLIIERYSAIGITDDNLSLLSALTLGSRSGLSSSLIDSFRASGVAHVLVVSGMHVGLIYLAITLLLRVSRHKRLSAFVGLLLLWLYALIVGATLSVCRATFMFSVMLFMKVVGERYRSFHALFLSAFVQLLITPSALFDIGFQLSYSAVLSILIFYPLFPSFPNKVVSFFYNPIRLTVSAQILIAPLVAYYFGQFPVYFIITNLIVSLLVPVIFIGGFLALIPGFSAVLVQPLNYMLSFLQTTVVTIASMPMALVQVRITFAVLIMIYVLIALVVLYSII